MLIFLKHRGFLYFPRTIGLSLSDPSAFDPNPIETLTFSFFFPFKAFLARQASGSRQ